MTLPGTLPLFRDLEPSADQMPEGFRYSPDVLSDADERTLVRAFEKLPLQPFEFQGFLAKRANEDLQQFGAEDGRAKLLLFSDDLQQHRTGKIIAALVVDDLDVLTDDDQLTQVLEGHMPARARVVQAAIRILSYQAFRRHHLKLPIDMLG